MRTSPPSSRAVVNRRVVKSLNTVVCSSINPTSSACPGDSFPISASPVLAARIAVSGVLYACARLSSTVARNCSVLRSVSIRLSFANAR
jgi:hypothetical protein